MPLIDDAQDMFTIVTTEAGPCSGGGAERYRVFSGDNGRWFRGAHRQDMFGVGRRHRDLGEDA